MNTHTHTHTHTSDDNHIYLKPRVKEGCLQNSKNWEASFPQVDLTARGCLVSSGRLDCSRLLDHLHVQHCTEQVLLGQQLCVRTLRFRFCIKFSSHQQLIKCEIVLPLLLLSDTVQCI